MQDVKSKKQKNTTRRKGTLRRPGGYTGWEEERYTGRKDRLFRSLFEKDREALLQLYNALNGTDYREASELQVVTLEGASYMVMKNGLAFVVAGTLNLYEHQSTLNPNMPVRSLLCGYLTSTMVITVN